MNTKQATQRKVEKRKEKERERGKKKKDYERQMHKIEKNTTSPAMFPSNKLSPRHQSCPGVVLIRYMEIPRVHQGVKAHVDQMRCPRHQLRQAFRHGPHLPQEVRILRGFGDVNQEMDAERVAGAQGQGRLQDLHGL